MMYVKDFSLQKCNHVFITQNIKSKCLNQSFSSWRKCQNFYVILLDLFCKAAYRKYIVSKNAITKKFNQEDPPILDEMNPK